MKFSNVTLDFRYNTVIDTMEKRKSCRKFAPYRIYPNERILLDQAANSAPYASGGPRRSWRVYDEPGLGEYCFNQPYVDQASLRVVFMGRDVGTFLRSGHPKYLFDCAAACMCMDLMAVALGYGTCWIGHFDTDRLRNYVNAHLDEIPVIILLVGRRADEADEMG